MQVLSGDRGFYSQQQPCGVACSVCNCFRYSVKYMSFNYIYAYIADTYF